MPDRLLVMYGLEVTGMMSGPGVTIGMKACLPIGPDWGARIQPKIFVLGHAMHIAKMT